MAGASYRYFGSGMAAPFHLLSNFNECRIAGRVYVLDDNEREENADNQLEQRGGASCTSSGEDAETSATNTEDNAVSASSGDDAEASATRAKYVLREFMFPSAEHYWWAHFARNAADVSRLAVGGDLSTLEGGLRLLLGPQAGAQKAKHWRKKGNVGIVAKMLAARSRAGRPTSSRVSATARAEKPSDCHRYRAKTLRMELGLHPLPQYGEQGGMATLREIWKKIQTEKFTQNPEHRRVLISTGSETLVEFIRMRPDGNTWGAQVRGGVKHSGGLIVGGELVGGNFIGKCLMAVRASL